MSAPGTTALAALCACLLAVSAAAAPVNGPLAEQDVAPDQESASLLLKMVQQIAAGRTVSPMQDNALATWGEVRRRAQERTPGVARALQDFIKFSESRVANERQAGHEMVVFDLQAFTSMAEELLQRVATSAPGPDGHQPGADEPSPAAAAVVPSDAASPPVQPVAAPVKPPASDAVIALAAPLASRAVEPAAAAVKPPASDAVVALTTPLVSPPQRSSPEQQRMAETFTSRGDAMLAVKDISAARKLYEQAANLGSAAAAKGLARTYDPAYLDRIGIIGMRPDIALAANWYDRAAALGDREAAQRVRELDAMLGTPLPAKATP